MSHLPRQTGWWQVGRLRQNKPRGGPPAHFGRLWRSNVPPPAADKQSAEFTSHSEFQLALACLVHPFSLLALGLLALNDHWWKGVGPAWITGKLSDFAGLFYFPFLVIVFVALMAGRRTTESRLAIGRFAFWSVGIWFAAAKSVPVVHSITVRFAEVIVGDVVGGTCQRR
jgi:hypothetical protein